MYFRAFSTRFSTIWRSRSPSTGQTSGSSGRLSSTRGRETLQQRAQVLGARAQGHVQVQVVQAGQVRAAGQLGRAVLNQGQQVRALLLGLGVPQQVAGQQQRLQRAAQFMAGQAQGLALAGLAAGAAVHLAAPQQQRPQGEVTLSSPVTSAVPSSTRRISSSAAT